MARRVALITGAGGGVGTALAHALAARGYAIAAVDRKPDGLESLAEAIRAIQGECAWTLADVTQPDAMRGAVAEMERLLGPIDLLVGNAGIGVETSALDLNADDVARVVNVNLLGLVNSVAAVLPGMLARKAGHIVAISSIASLRGMPHMLGYCASKAGVNAFMDGLRVEVRPLGLHVTTICPSWIRTAMTDGLHDRLPDLMPLDAAIRHIVWAIERRKLYHAFPWFPIWRLRMLQWLPRSWQDAVLAMIARDVKRED